MISIYNRFRSSLEFATEILLPFSGGMFDSYSSESDSLGSDSPESDSLESDLPESDSHSSGSVRKRDLWLRVSHSDAYEREDAPRGSDG